MNNVEVIIQRVRYANGYGVDLSLRHEHTNLEPFLVRDWHFKEKIIPESMRAIVLLAEGMAATLGTNLIYLLSLDRTDLQLDDDIYI